MSELKSLITTIKDAIKDTDFNETNKNFRDYKEIKINYNSSLIKSCIQKLKTILLTANDQNLSSLVYDLDNAFKQKNKIVMLNILEKINSSNKDISFTKKEIHFKIPSLPSDIQEDIASDIKELELCFNSACYRSSIILCGRILEIALHRKYYEITNTDLLEKAPGIGLGKLIAKLKEKNIEFEPGLTQQIHLINNVRIYSVHKKSSKFNPTKKQTHAIILYTLDILNKLF